MKPVIIIGGGSSIKPEIERGLWEKIQGKAEIWSVNFTHKFLPYRPDRQLWLDSTFFMNDVGRRNEPVGPQELKKLQMAGVLLCTCVHPLYKSEIYKDIKQYETTRTATKEEFDKAIFIGGQGLSGVFALSLAVREGYDPIYLLGYDYGTTSYEDRNTHFYQDKVAEKKIQSSGLANTEVYLQRDGVPQGYVKEYEVYKNYPNKVFNVSLKSNLSTFEKISYDEFFERLINER